MLKRTSQVAVFGALGARFSFGQETLASVQSHAIAVTGQRIGEEVGERVLAEGGNAVDAAVAAALAVCVAMPSACGIGGYGGVLTLALAGGKKVVAIDFNSTAPAAARPDMYPLTPDGEVEGRVNFHGWLAAGVPGTLAGLELALKLYGTRPFRDVVQPALKLARDGVEVTGDYAAMLRGAMPRFAADSGSARTYLKNGEPPKRGDTLKNPDLAGLLETLARRDSVDSFYRGDIAKHIAREFKKHGGLVTEEDLAAFQAREVEPLRLTLGDFTVYTSPLTAGGLTTLEALGILQALGWDKLPATPEREHASIEALRWSWRDRLELLGDPEFVDVPVAKLLSADYLQRASAKVRAAVKARKPLDLTVPREKDAGTTNISAVDRHGNMVALTVTQGAPFGARVTVEGLGLTLGHGMSRFVPKPGHPNSIAPRKRPLHNMCPAVVLRRGQPVLALGGSGGLKIPNAIFDVIRRYVWEGQTAAEAVGGPRSHTTGALDLIFRGDWPKADLAYLREVGFNAKRGGSAAVSAVALDAKTGASAMTTR